MQNVTIAPSLSNFTFLLNGKELGKEIAISEVNNNDEMSLKLTLTGVEELDRANGISHFLNVCVYETNYSTGRGYRILNLYTLHLPVMMSNSPYFEEEFQILKNNSELRPMEGGFEGDLKTACFDYNKSFISVKVFFSVEDLTNSEDLQDIFFNNQNVIMDTKVPFKQVLK